MASQSSAHQARVMGPGEIRADQVKRARIRAECYKNAEELRRGNMTDEDLVHAADKQDKLLDTIEKTHITELVLDAAVYRQIAERAHQSLKGQRAAVTFTPKHLVEKISQNCEGRRPGTIDWAKIATTFAGTTTQTTPGCQFFNDALSAEPGAPRVVKPRVARQAATHVVAPIVRPDDVAPPERTAQSESDIRSFEMLQVLNDARDKGQRCHYYEFVVDCDSFGQTIENVFALSMLVNMGVVGFVIVDDQPYIEVLQARNETKEQEMARKTKNEHVPHKQHIMKLDTKIWREIIDVYELQGAFFRCSVASEIERDDEI